PPGLAEPLGRVLATGEHYLPTDYSCVVTLRLGREDRHYLPRILAIGDKLTEFKGAAIILQDVTKFRLLDDAKTNLVGTVSHELKTPLTSLRMAVYLLLEQKLEGLTATQRDLLETARKIQLRKYSKGMLQRVGLAQAILNDPKVVILDEPMSGLDPVGRREVRDIILQLKKDGKTVMFSTHILSDAEMLCDRVGVIVGGKLRGVGAPG